MTWQDILPTTTANMVTLVGLSIKPVSLTQPESGFYHKPVWKRWIMLWRCAVCPSDRVFQTFSTRLYRSIWDYERWHDALSLSFFAIESLRSHWQPNVSKFILFRIHGLIMRTESFKFYIKVALCRFIDINYISSVCCKNVIFYSRIFAIISGVLGFLTLSRISSTCFDKYIWNLILTSGRW